MTPQLPSTIHNTAEENITAEKLVYLQKMEAFALLAVGVVHDLNNALQNARLTAEAFGQTGDKPLEAAAQILEDIDVASSFTRALLDIVRRQTPSARAIDLGDTTTRVLRFIGRTLPETIRLVARVAKNVWPVLLSDGQCEQILLNLLVNARDAMPAGGVLTVEVANRRVTRRTIEKYRMSDWPSPSIFRGDYVVLRVKDTGTGIPKEVQAQIYQPFWTSKEASAGTGIGLTLCHSIIAAAGGAIFAESNGRVGTVFTVLLPRHRERATPSR
jgi:two-component system cell cycle sensor histidine kinase/response regulator CckA